MKLNNSESTTDVCPRLHCISIPPCKVVCSGSLLITPHIPGKTARNSFTGAHQQNSHQKKKNRKKKTVDSKQAEAQREWRRCTHGDASDPTLCCQPPHSISQGVTTHSLRYIQVQVPEHVYSSTLPSTQTLATVPPRCCHDQRTSAPPRSPARDRTPHGTLQLTSTLVGLSFRHVYAHQLRSGTTSFPPSSAPATVAVVAVDAVVGD